ncbi:SGNH/GDSL hydrolase family protein [Virgibacillus halodenitrificans]|uniref:SGNH/GDSL hydrolase family protein n=1 Tax=Virgibacillus halodenitrificans TaxID=1482 RepID=UPI00045C3DB0|nr:SGNH/GDSL hydrolase family protein [Virgibacillus halodenitrificans]CDQ31627.1 Spore germination lipase LipC [Virgibacillus halodenitrificans]
MNKKIIGLITGVVMLIGIAVIIINMNQPEPDFKNVRITDEDEETITQQPANDEEENMQEEESENPAPLKEIVVKAVKQTVDFFSTKETQILAIGDSLTQGVGDSTEQGGYVGILDRSINQQEELVDFANLGIRGNRSDQLLKRLEKPEVVDAINEADIILITIGANDIMKVVKENFTHLKMEDFTEEKQNYEQRLEKIFNKMQSINPDSHIYLLGFYNPFKQYFEDIKELSLIIEEWNESGRKIAGDHENITYIPTADLFDEDDTNLFSEDNFHPNELGYKRIARRVLNYLTHEEG